MAQIETQQHDVHGKLGQRAKGDASDAPLIPSHSQYIDCDIGHYACKDSQGDAAGMAVGSHKEAEGIAEHLKPGAKHVDAEIVGGQVS